MIPCQYLRPHPTVPGWTRCKIYFRRMNRVLQKKPKKICGWRNNYPANFTGCPYNRVGWVKICVYEEDYEQD